MVVGLSSCSDSSSDDSVKSNFKDMGKSIGHGARDITRTIGHDTRNIVVDN